jgi:hypothetical protein
MDLQTESVTSSRRPRAEARKSPRPDIPVSGHPISGFYYVATPSVETFFNTVAQWIEIGVPGGCITGRPQLGKTWAQDYIKAHICEKMGEQFPVFQYSCPDNLESVITENKFFGDMLDHCGHDLADSGNAAVKRRRLVNFMVERAHSMGASKILLLADEAQQLTNFHYTWLMAIYNQLHRHGIRMITVLSGQPQLLIRRADLKSEGEAQIIGRFMLLQTEFTGLRSVTDFKKTLELYDFEEKFPLDSEWTYTRFFLPRAYDAGLRLSAQAQLIWNLYEEVSRAAGLPPFSEIGMGDFASFVQCMLKLNMEADDEGFTLDREVLLEAIQYSGFVSRAQTAQSKV